MNNHPLISLKHVTQLLCAVNHEEILNRETETLLKMGITDTSTSPYSAPAVLVKQKETTGKKRLCVDYRKLNAITVKDTYPMPNKENIIPKLRGAKYFTTLDLARGYWQIPLEEDAKPLTAFTTPFGCYQWNYMSFGLTNAPVTFNRMMAKLLGKRPDVIFYLDDICVFHNTLEEQVAPQQSSQGREKFRIKIS
uniref:Reverse transcriptase domain-containing protein n=1 Tax=Biomphalaria glabrata TaxID=6526 RepID=A0A2C9LU40_BIOGL